MARALRGVGDGIPSADHETFETQVSHGARSSGPWNSCVRNVGLARAEGAER